MSRFPNTVRFLNSFFSFILDLVTDGLRFVGLAVGSRSALSAEVLFLRKQLAFYEEREVQPRRLNDSARLSLVFWSRLFDWKNALVIVKTGDPHRLASQGLQAVLKMEIAGWSPAST
jgi:hypothetical protein